jgi:cell division protein FtsB
MRLRRRFADRFGLFALPLISGAVILYFGYSGVAGPRGLVAWHDAEMDLAVKRAELGQVRHQREALQHRIALMNANALDPDMLEEVARGVLSEGKPGEVAVPRDKH